MNDDQLLQALSKIVDKKTLQEIQNKVVFKSSENQYELYGRYVISQQDQNYIISTSSDNTLGIFGSIKSAVAYITYDLRCMIHESKRVLELDSRLTGLEVAIQIHERLYNKSKDFEHKLIYLSKLQEDKLKRKQTLHELNSFVRSAYDWQMRKFKQQATKTHQTR